MGVVYAVHMTEIRSWVSQYVVTALPDDDVDQHTFSLTVERRAPDRWAICWLGMCFSKNGTWDYEALPSERTNEWKDDHRFDMETALALAKGEVMKIKVNGLTVDGLMEWRKAKGSVT